MTALLIAEHDNQTLKPATAQAVTALLQMTEAVDVLVAGNHCQAIAEAAAKLRGVRSVLLAESPKLAQECPEVLAQLVVDEAEGYSHIFFAARTGRPPCPARRRSLICSPSPRFSP